MDLASDPDLPSPSLSLWRQQPCAGVALWWACAEIAESWRGTDGETTRFPKWCPRARARGAHARREPAPGLCTHLNQLRIHRTCLYSAQPLLEQPLALLQLMCAAQQHKAHRHTRCTTRSMGESQETASAEGFFLLEEPLLCLLQPQAGDTAWSCGTATFTRGLQLEPSSGWMAAASINPGVRKAEQQFKNLRKKKLFTLSPTPQQGGTSPSTMLCSHMETIASHASVTHSYQHSRALSGLKNPSVCTVRARVCPVEPSAGTQLFPKLYYSFLPPSLYSLYCLRQEDRKSFMPLPGLPSGTTVLSSKPGELPASPAWRAPVLPGAGA